MVILLFSSVVLGASADDLIDGTQPNRILEIAKGFGSASLEKDSDGDPQIVCRMEGVKYVIFFYGCKSGQNCDQVQFHASWKDTANISFEKANRYNAKKRLGRAYKRDDGDVAIDMLVNLAYGVTKRNFESTFEAWATALRSFKKEVLDAP
jgi:hypothetical protein